MFFHKYSFDYNANRYHFFLALLQWLPLPRAMLLSSYNWCVLSLCLALVRSQREVELLVGETRNFSVQESVGAVTVVFYLNRTAEDQVRVRSPNC